MSFESVLWVSFYNCEMFTIFFILKLDKLFNAIFYKWVFHCETLKMSFVVKSPEQVEDQSCKNDFEDIPLQSEKEDNFFQMNVNECVR